MASWDPLSMAQDVIRCTLCEDAPAEVNCNKCHVCLCDGCVSKHITSKKSRKHDIVPFTAKKSRIPLPKCTSHSDIKCDFHCRQCKLPICSECLTSQHKMHDLVRISDNIAAAIAGIHQETIELETVITEEYNKIKTETKSKLPKIQKEYQSLKKSISDHGKIWHRELEIIIVKLIKDVEKMENEDLAILNKQLTQLEKILTDVKNTSLKNKQILTSNDSTLIFNHESRNKEFCKVPSRLELSSPSFAPLRIEGLNLMKQFGTLTTSIKTELSDYNIKIKDSISSLSSVKQLLDVPTEVTTTETGDTMDSMTTANIDQMWIGRWSRINRVDIHGTTLETINTFSGQATRGLTMTKEGHLIYTDSHDNTVNLVGNGKIKNMIRTGGWEPSSVCSTSTGDLLACLRKDKKHKVVRYSNYKVKQEIQYDDKNKSLFAVGSAFLFVAENRDQNICVSDPNAHTVVVLDQTGKLQFRYDGNLVSKMYKSFTPCGIATDSQIQILIADCKNHCVHIINRIGIFLRYIDNCNLYEPFCVSVDSSDRLFVSCYDLASVKIIEYMK